MVFGGVGSISLITKVKDCGKMKGVGPLGLEGDQILQ